MVVSHRIGGVAQVTYIKGDLVLAFDTGPGNAPIDDWMHRHSGRPVDEDGAFAATGKVNGAALETMLANPFFDRAPAQIAGPDGFRHGGGRGAIARRWRGHPDRLHRRVPGARPRAFSRSAETWIVSGGGRHNKTLMAMLKARVNAPVISAEDAGWDGDALEAHGFAYLAMRSKKGLPLSLPTTTGVQQPMTGGRFWR